MQPQHRKALYLRSRNSYKPSFANPFFKPSKPKKSKRFYYSLILLGAALAGWVYFLFFSSAFKVTDWEINGLKIYKKDNIEYSLQQFLDNPKLFIFNYSNILTFNARDFKDYLAREYAFADIKITKYFPHKVIINLKEKEPKAAVYNQNKIYVIAEDGAVIIKKEGIEGWFSVQENNEITSASTTSSYNIEVEKLITDSKTKDLPAFHIFCDAYYTKDSQAGQTYPASAAISVINKFIDNVHEKTNIKIKLAALVKNQINPKIIIYTENNWKIYLNSTEDGLKQFYKFYTAFQEQIKDINKPLEYIDLRFGDMVYIK
ncbi:MAG: hypothetical protein WC459_02280 [Patescibacteria group bacterium]